MKIDSQKVATEEFILSVLSPEERLGAAFKIASAAFGKKNNLTFEDIQKAVKKIRKRVYAEK